LETLSFDNLNLLDQLKDGFWEDGDLVGQTAQYEGSFYFSTGMDING
jgi:hypothetical protein